MLYVTETGHPFRLLRYICIYHNAKIINNILTSPLCFDIFNIVNDF